MQFTYRPNRSTDDAVSLALHYTLHHLEAKDTHGGILFIDFNSAFNTIFPFKLFEKLQDTDINTSTYLLILDFLRDRSKVVRAKNPTSLPLTTNTGVPQGCVLSPLLFSLFSNQLRSTSDSIRTMKYLDGTAIIGLITNDDKDTYRLEVERAVNWCRTNNLLLNEKKQKTKKTFEMITHFRTTPSVKSPILLTANPLRYLTVSYSSEHTISNNLKWDLNVNHQTKNAQERLYFLRQLKRNKVKQSLLIKFYTAIIQIILSLSDIVWFGNSSKHTMKSMDRIITRASKIIG